MTKSIRTITPALARQIAVTRQHLSGTPRPTEHMLNVVRDMGCLQLDPTSAVARNHLLVLWSRMGIYDQSHLENLLWKERTLFEYWAHAASIVLTEDYPIHADMMRRYGQRESWGERTKSWMKENQALRDHILSQLAQHGPLSSKSFEDKSTTGWQSSGWTSGRNVSQMLDFLWTEGKILVTERRGGTRYWDLAERVLPDWHTHDPLPQEEVVKRAAQKSLRALGVGTSRQIIQHYTRNRYPELPAVMKALEKEDRIERVEITEAGITWPGEWYMHVDDVPLLDALERGEFTPRTTLLSPFDNLICDRTRTEKMFNFEFRIEIYVPKDKRKYGYFVLPILHGDRLIGRIDPLMNRKENRLMVNAVYAEPDAPADAGGAVAEAVQNLAAFLSAESISYTDRLPDIWKLALKSE